MASVPWTAITPLMRGYYVYIMGDDGQVQDRVDVMCDDDEEAMRRAGLRVDGHAIELWQETRRIAEFKPDK